MKWKGSNNVKERRKLELLAKKDLLRRIELIHMKKKNNNSENEFMQCKANFQIELTLLRLKLKEFSRRERRIKVTLIKYKNSETI